MTNVLNALRPRLKAVAAGLVALATYFAGVVPAKSEGLSGFAHLTTAQWLGAVIFVGAAYHITYAVPNLAKKVPTAVDTPKDAA